MFDFDAYTPQNIAQKVDAMGVQKVKMPIVPLFMLGMLAGAFIGLGAMLYVMVISDLHLGFAVSQLLGGLAFCLGLILVVIAGAELFTANNLIIMAWADSKITAWELAKNWAIVCAANMVGAFLIALLIYLSGHTAINDNGIAYEYVQMALSKNALSPTALILKGTLCNIMLCLAFWMAYAGRTVTDKILAILLPVIGLVAAGFEHSVANMYYYPMAMMIQQFSVLEHGAEAITLVAYFRNLLFVIIGNIIGGSLIVGLVYHLIYRFGFTKMN